MKEISLLIGGKAGDGINQSGLLLARLLSNLGYFVYMYFDYPSLIRGGHNFAIVRASENKILSHRNKVDYILAINQDTVDFHSRRLRQEENIIYDSDVVKSKGLGVPLGQIIKQENARPIMRNSCLIGAFSKSVGIDWQILERTIRKNIEKETDLNLRLALRGYEQVEEQIKIEALQRENFPVLTGNEATGLGLISAGLDAYIAYPMTPASGLLHFLAGVADDFGLRVIHPENEIGVMLMALGFSYAGKRVAVGTSGGGFCLMTEGLSLSGMAELPVVIFIGQRPGPSTGVPTYTAQSDLHFALNAGHGEFIRFVVSPGDPEEAFYWSGVALNISWRYQIPSIVLSDKALGEGAYSFNRQEVGDVKIDKALLWDRKDSYKRYLNTQTGISPLAFVPEKEAVIKVNSYEHDEYGLTIEEPGKITTMYQKRLRKGKGLAQELEDYEAVKTYGNNDSSVALLCYGSNKGVCKEVGESLGLKVIQPIVLSPFPIKQLRDSLTGIKKLITVENNATAQFVRLLNNHGLDVDEKILKFDGRPFALEELEEEIKKRGNLWK
jgi:2-oxoglutarate ferredoxin oxidoreductase subunit alpha